MRLALSLMSSLQVAISYQQITTRHESSAFLFNSFIIFCSRDCLEWAKVYDIAVRLLRFVKLSDKQTNLKTLIEWEMNWKKGKWLAPANDTHNETFIEIDVLRFLFFYWVSSLPSSKNSNVENTHFNWLQFGAIFRSIVRLTSGWTRRAETVYF